MNTYRKQAYGSVLGIFLVLPALWSATAHALPLPAAGLRPLGDAAASALTFEPAATVDFTAIIALSNCSGSLVRFNSSLGTDQAMVLTNGHCLDGGFLRPGQIVVNKPVSRSLRLLSADGRKTLATLHAARIIYGTMSGTDMALYGLAETYDMIQKGYGVTALTLSAAHPVAGRPITIASGYWRRIYSCSIDRFVQELREDSWTWKDSILYRQPGCNTIGGTSGSPIIDSETYEVVGVNNTGNESGGRCTMNNPCEVDGDGNVTVTPKASYGQQTYWLYSCLDSANQLQLDRPGCQLPKPASRVTTAQ